MILLAILLPVGVVASAAANGASGGVGPAVLKCMHFKDGMVLTPGLTFDPTDQSVSAHGRLYGCNKAGGSARFTGSLHMTQATCADLSMAGNTRFDWSNGKSSTAFLRFIAQDVEPNKVFITGTIGSGLFRGLIVQAWVRFTPDFKGTGPGCTDTNKLRKIDFTNSQSYQLLTPPTTTTTVPQNPTTTTEPRTTTTRRIPRTTTTSHSTTSTTDTTAPPTSTSTSTNEATTSTVTVAGSTEPPTTASPGPTGTSPRGGGLVIGNNNTGGLAFTGNNRAGALVGLESLIIGGALACYGRDRRTRRAVLRARVTGAKSWLHVELPPRA